MSQLKRVFLGSVLAICSIGVSQGQDFRIASYTQLTSNGGRVAWSPADNNLIAFDRVNSVGYYDVWTMNPDGSNQVCLTCNKSTAPAYNKGNPDWHPSGSWIVMQAEQASDDNLNSKTRPGAGLNNGIYIMDAAGDNYYQVPESFGAVGNSGVLHPHFSHDGTKLLWAQAVNLQRGTAEWELELGTFSVVNGVPSVTNIQTLQPGQCHSLYETHGFSLDDSTIFFSGAASCQSEYGIDIYSYNLNTGAFADLTNTPTQWDEHSRPMPNINKLVWVTSMQTDSTPLNLKNEFWMMDYDGGNKKRISWFNDSRGPACVETGDGTGPCSIAGGRVASDSDWSHDGTQFVGYLVDTGGSSSLGNTGSIWLFTIEPSSTTVSTASYLRPPVSPDSISTSFGTNLATSTASASGSLGDNLGGSVVTVTDAQGTTRNSSLFYASSGQVNWYIPAGTVDGPAVVTTTSSSGAVLRDTFSVENVAPGIFTADSSGIGAAAAYAQVFSAGVANPPAQYTFNCSSGTCQTSPVNLGNGSGPAFLILFATGVVHHTGTVTVTIGSTKVSASFAGASGETGLDQINVQVPASFAGSGTQQLTLTVDGNVSNPVQVQFQ